MEKLIKQLEKTKESLLRKTAQDIINAVESYGVRQPKGVKSRIFRQKKAVNKIGHVILLLKEK